MFLLSIGKGNTHVKVVYAVSFNVKSFIRVNTPKHIPSRANSCTFQSVTSTVFRDGELDDSILTSKLWYAYTVDLYHAPRLARVRR